MGKGAELVLYTVLATGYLVHHLAYFSDTSSRGSRVFLVSATVFMNRWELATKKTEQVTFKSLFLNKVVSVRDRHVHLTQEGGMLLADTLEALVNLSAVSIHGKYGSRGSFVWQVSQQRRWALTACARRDRSVTHMRAKQRNP